MTVNSEPRPTPSLSAVMLPPCASVRWRTIASPRPSPPVLASGTRFSLTKSLEDVRQHVRRDADARVANGDGDVVLVLRHLHLDLAVTRCVLQRVRQQVPEHLLQPLAIARHRHGAFRHLAADRLPLRRGGGADGFHRRADGIDEVHLAHVEPQLPTDDLRHLQDVAHQLLLAARIALDDLDGALPRRLVERALPQHARPAHDGVERGTQLVREGGEELVFQAAGGFSFTPRIAFARQQLRALAFIALAARDVLDERHVLGRGGALEWRGEDGNLDGCPILPPHNLLEASDRHTLTEPCGEFGTGQKRERLRALNRIDHLRGFVSQQSLGRAIPALDRPVTIEQHDGEGRRVDDGRQRGGRAAQPGFRVAQAQQRADVGDELGRIGRLGEVGVGAGSQAGGAMRRITSRRPRPAGWVYSGCVRPL